MKIFIVVSSITLILLNIFDCYSTVLLLKHGGIEANPIMSVLMDIFGVLPSLIITKLLFIGLLILAGFKAVKKKSLPNREVFTVYSAYCFAILYYSYFMYNYNFQQYLLVR